MSAIPVRVAVFTTALAILLAGIGWELGGATGGSIVLAIGLVLNAVSYGFSERIALRRNRTRPLSRDEAPALHALVERLSGRCGVPVPRLHVIASASPNAFATGHRSGHATISVTEGLLALLDERQLEAVIALELARIKQRDVVLATVAVAWMIVPLLPLALLVVLERTRGSCTDAIAARMTRDPGGLADALERLAAWSQHRRYELAGLSTAHLFVVSPLAGRRVLGWLPTHPPLDARVARLRAQAHRRLAARRRELITAQ